MALPEVQLLGARLRPGWQRPSLGLVAKYDLHLSAGLAAPSSTHLYLEAAEATKQDLANSSIRQGIQMLRGYTRPGSGSPLSAMGMAYSQLARASVRNIRALAAQSGAKDVRLENRTKKVLTLVNPSYEGIESAGQTLRLESCFSGPGVGVRVLRWNEIILYIPGKKPRRVGGTTAWVLQHEIDHLNGILCTTRALEQGRPLYFLPPEWSTTFFRGGFTESRPIFPTAQYDAMRSGAFDLAAYIRLL